MDFAAILPKMGLFDYLQPVAAISRIILEQNMNETGLNTVVTEQLPASQLPLVGILPGVSPQEPTPPAEGRQKQPAPIWKGLAFTIADILQPTGDLAYDGHAFFVAAPKQFGVPGGVKYPDEVVNYQLFELADCVQRLNHVFFNLDGDSYFQDLAL
jgi:hypothetical protein